MHRCGFWVTWMYNVSLAVKFEQLDCPSNGIHVPCVDDEVHIALELVASTW